MTASLAYRTNEAAILRGEAPAKYLRILPHIPPGRVLELGSAEGVLACLLGRERTDEIVALEANPKRHDAAVSLFRDWARQFRFMSSPHFVNGQIQERLDLLDDTEVLVAVRMIYYLRAEIDTVFSAIAAKVPCVVLCGNRNRADNWRRGTPHEPLGPFNKYAAREGMRELLERHGYEITAEVREGDEIVVGRR